MARSSAYLNPDVIGRVAAIGFRAGEPKEGNVAGLHRSPLHGHSPEFADYRSYTPGDDLKGLDWRAFARSDRFYIKRFEEESNLRAFFLIDASASMRYGKSLTKFDCAATAATSLAAVLLRQRDAVAATVLSAGIRHELPPSGTASQLMKLVELLESVELAGETDLGSAISLVADKLPRRGLVVVLSDLLTPLNRLYDALGKLQYANHEIVLFHVLHRDEVELPFNDSVIFRDIEGTEELFAEPWSFRTAYRSAMQKFIEDVRERCQYCGIDYVRLYTDEDLGRALSHFLHVRQQRGPSRHRGRMSSLPGDEEEAAAS
jgi:uncharacterized protein (DUF58 family)